jgi:hypothetical protein
MHPRNAPHKNAAPHISPLANWLKKTSTNYDCSAQVGSQNPHIKSCKIFIDITTECVPTRMIKGNKYPPVRTGPAAFTLHTSFTSLFIALALLSLLSTMSTIMRLRFQ